MKWQGVFALLAPAPLWYDWDAPKSWVPGVLLGAATLPVIILVVRGAYR
jgi:hypothetical protein